MKTTEIVIVLLLLSTVLGQNYDPQIAIALGYASAAVYAEVGSIRMWSCRRCRSFMLQNVSAEYYPVQKLQWLIGYSPRLNAIVGSFRGTKQMKNVIQDLKVKTADYSCYKCKVHLGFYSNYLAFKPDLMEKIKVLKLAYPSALVFMTGHSLGAALAVFAAIDVGETYDSPTIVYNFGQPRIGNSQFNNFLSLHIKQYYRIINRYDPVPHNPIRNKHYIHGGQQIWYHDKGMINYRQCDPEDKKGMRGLMMIAHLNSINDHKLPAYLKIKAKGIYLEIDRKEVGEWEGEEEGEGKNVKTREDHLALTTSSGSVITTSGTSVPTTYGVGASNVPTINVPIPVPVTTTTSIPSNAVPTQQLNVQINPSQQINQQVVVLQQSANAHNVPLEVVLPAQESTTLTQGLSGTQGLSTVTQGSSTVSQGTTLVQSLAAGNQKLVTMTQETSNEPQTSSNVPQTSSTATKSSPTTAKSPPIITQGPPKVAQTPQSVPQSPQTVSQSPQTMPQTIPPTPTILSPLSSSIPQISTSSPTPPPKQLDSTIPS